MIVSKVIDASALLAVMFAEPGYSAVISRLADTELFAPTLLRYEIGNVCAVKVRRSPDRVSDILLIFDLLPTYGIKLIEPDHAGVLSLAIRHGLAAYDASYLWLARHLGCELVTLDRWLAAAAVS